MRLAFYTMAAMFYVLCAPRAFVDWIAELRRRSKARQEAERSLFEDETP